MNGLKAHLGPHWNVVNKQGDPETPTEHEILKNKFKVICKRVIFYSNSDEDIFFTWLKMSQCIAFVEGIKDEIHLYVELKSFSRDDWLNLRALFERYKINLNLIKKLKPEDL